MESERAAEEFEFDKTLFENWDAKGYPEKATAMLQWLAANDIDEPMPEYEMGEGSHNNVPALAKWAVDNLYYPLRNAYHGNNKDGTPSINGVVDETHRAYADSMAKDVFTCGGKNTSNPNMYNAMYGSILSEDDMFYAGNGCELVSATDIIRLKSDPYSDESAPGFVVLYKEGVFYQTVEYNIVEVSGRKMLRAMQSFADFDPPQSSEHVFYNINRT